VETKGGWEGGKTPALGGLGGGECFLITGGGVAKSSTGRDEMVKSTGKERFIRKGEAGVDLRRRGVKQKIRRYSASKGL